MMNCDEILKELASYGQENIRKIYLKHGAAEPFFGVKIEDMKKIVKRVGKNQQLASELWETRNGDAMYLAGYLSEPRKMEKEEISRWAEEASWHMLSEYTVAWVASESRFGMELSLEWVDDPREHVASSGWSTLSSILALVPNDRIDPALIRSLIDRVKNTIHQQANRVRYTMNAFLIAVAGYLPELREECIEAAQSIGPVKVDMGGTSCKVPEAKSYIQKISSTKGELRKRKTSFC